MDKIIDVVKKRYTENVSLEWAETKDSDVFYFFIYRKLNQFLSTINDVDKNEFMTESNNLFFTNPFSKSRCMHLLQRIIEACLEILKSCYKGDLYSANLLLNSLLSGKNSKCKQYLIENYINYFDFSVLKNQSFYRMRDSKEGQIVDNCSHVPFNMRYKIDSNRFSLQGLPCLYLANSPETADKELRSLNDGCCRWISEFVPNSIIPVMDLRFHSISWSDDMPDYDLFKLIITYPIRLFCSIRVKHENCNFNEEYYFPQLLSHFILVHLKERPNEHIYYGGKGIMFDSTVNEGGYNLIFPAYYNDVKPPHMGHSQYLSNLFSEVGPTIYKTSAISTT